MSKNMKAGDKTKINHGQPAPLSGKMKKKMEKEYKIKRVKRANENYETMIIINRATGEEIAEYRLTAGEERKEINQMRRSINKHLDEPGATLHNYQW